MAAVTFGLCIAAQYPTTEAATERMAEHVAQVQMARSRGFASVWASHHYLAEPFQMLQPLPLLARLAAAAEGMTLGTAILLIPLLNPVDVAEQVATLDIITGGRFVLGVGLGYRELENQLFGVPPGKRVSRFMETLTVVKQLWTEETVDFSGEHYQLSGVRLLTKPLQTPRPPIWIAANSDNAVRRAARQGDTWLINPHATLTALKPQVALFRRTRSEAGLPPATELPLMRELFVAEDRETALREAQPYLERKYKTYTQWGQDKAMPTADDFSMAFEQLLADRFIIGSPEDCIEQIARYQQELGVTQLLLRMQWPGMPQELVLRSIRLVGERIIPHFHGGD